MKPVSTSTDGNDPRMQPIVWVGKVIRFKENKIVSALLEASSAGRKLDLNDIACMNFPRKDREQFAQLIGYSVSGYGDLSFVSRRSMLAADKVADAMSAKRKRK